MVNTNNGTLVKDPVEFQINGITNPANIKLEVLKNNVWVEMTANRGEPAAKIAVNQDFDFCDEREPITTKYPNFHLWVENIDYIWW